MSAVDERTAAIRAEVLAILHADDGSPERLDAAMSAHGSWPARYFADGWPEAAPAVRRRYGRWLVAHAEHALSREIGLTLLSGVAEAEDVEALTEAAFGDAAEAAITVLEHAPDGAAHLLRVVKRASGSTRNHAVAALCRLSDPVGDAWLLRRGVLGPDDWSGVNAVLLAPLLTRNLPKDPENTKVVRHAARILVAWPRQRSGAPEDASSMPALFEAFAEVSAVLPPKPDDLALLARIAEDLYFHAAANLDWSKGARDRIAGALLSTLRRRKKAVARFADAPDPKIRARARWLRQTVGRVAAAREAGPRPFAIELVAPDPGTKLDPELRVLVNGRPLITTELHRGVEEYGLRALAATAEAREVLLADRNCEPECCGGLYVTVERRGDTVVWHRWRQPLIFAPMPLTELRLDAATYDAELARAAADRSWEWPARTVARLVNQALAERQTDRRRYVFAPTNRRTKLRLVWIGEWEDAITIPDDPDGLPAAELRRLVAEVLERFAGETTASDPRDHMVTR